MSTGRRILLVDDESGILDTLRILLRGNGYDVVAALSGREAIEMLPGASPDIVLTDIRMPGLTGLEVMAKAHEIDPETAVILMTAQASLQTAVQGGQRGRVLLPPKAIRQRRAPGHLPQGPRRRGNYVQRTRPSRRRSADSRCRRATGRRGKTGASSRSSNWRRRWPRRSQPY